MKLVVLDGYTTNPGDLNWDKLRELGDLSVFAWTEQCDIIQRLRGAEAAITNKVKINKQIMCALPELKYIGIMATGTDSVDLETAKELGIVVTNVPVYSNYSVAQLTFGLILELCYHIDKHSRSIIQEKYWSKQYYNSYWLNPLVELYGKTLGIIGMGNIGQRVAAIGNAFGMKVIVYSRTKKDVPGVEWVTFEDLMRKSDIVTMHCPLTDATRGLINSESIKLMKRSAFFVNTSRGPLMVDKDVAEALNNDIIAGAGLDVLGKEPPDPDNPLLSAKNVVITPHIGWATIDARMRLVNTVADNLAAFINHEEKNVVNK